MWLTLFLVDFWGEQGGPYLDDAVGAAALELEPAPRHPGAEPGGRPLGAADGTHILRDRERLPRHVRHRDDGLVRRGGGARHHHGLAAAAQSYAESDPRIADNVMRNLCERGATVRGACQPCGAGATT